MTDNTPEAVENPFLVDRTVGALHGAAVGDALGGATEGYSPEQIRERWGGYVEGIVDPYHHDWQTARPHSPLHKGDGHITDDTIMTQLMAKLYVKLGRHLTAYDMADHLVPELLTNVMWIPELEKHTVPLNRLFLAEKYLALRLHWAHADPREAGVGNAVNCGAAMYMAPVGLVNAGHPQRAYAEAIDLAGAHQSSYGREAAGVLAASVAAAATPGSSVDHIVSVVLDLAKDGTRGAIEAVVEAAQRYSDWREAIESGGLRDAIRPFDTVADTYRDQGLGARRPSRVHSIEELPLALGMLVIAKGDYWDAMIGGVNYGRDSDSIASMAGAIAGALGGAQVVPTDLVEEIARASRTDLTTPAIEFAGKISEIRRADLEYDQRVRATSESILLAKV